MEFLKNKINFYIHCPKIGILSKLVGKYVCMYYVHDNWQSKLSEILI